ncbi:FAD-dependent oxidoreductase, partial [Salmonella enterica]|uniref:FAD-dependent oxidoreductase n=1 Tax=Salmonella enterica TaxID=28901 RepID=UPI000CBA86E4
MKIVIIGGVAAGTSAAVRARRNSEEADIVIYDRDVDVAHAGFATHYAVGGKVDSMEELVPKDPEWFKQYYNIDVQTSHEITEIDRENKIVHGKNLHNNEEFEDSYDVLVFANGTTFG